MALMDILRNYIDRNASASDPTVAHEHYDEVAHSAPPEIVAAEGETLRLAYVEVDDGRSDD